MDPLDLIDRGLTPMLVVPILVQLRADPAHRVRADLVSHHLLSAPGGQQRFQAALVAEDLLDGLPWRKELAIHVVGKDIYLGIVLVLKR